MAQMVVRPNDMVSPILWTIYHWEMICGFTDGPKGSRRIPPPCKSDQSLRLIASRYNSSSTYILPFSESSVLWARTIRNEHTLWTTLSSLPGKPCESLSNLFASLRNPRDSERSLLRHRMYPGNSERTAQMIPSTPRTEESLILSRKACGDRRSRAATSGFVDRPVALRSLAQ